MIKQAELEKTREKLLLEQQHLEKRLLAFQADNALDARSQTNELSFDEDFGDLGSDTFEREKDLSIELNVRNLLGQVTEALDRMDAGTYGTCASCGREIEEGRLEALPFSTLCMDCKELEERNR